MFTHRLFIDRYKCLRIQLISMQKVCSKFYVACKQTRIHIYIYIYIHEYRPIQRSKLTHTLYIYLHAIIIFVCMYLCMWIKINVCICEWVLVNCWQSREISKLSYLRKKLLYINSYTLGTNGNEMSDTEINRQTERQTDKGTNIHTCMNVCLCPNNGLYWN